MKEQFVPVAPDASVAFEIRIKRGETGGAGVLGHVTEFLVSQRGLSR